MTQARPHDDIPHSRAGDVYENHLTGERAVVLSGTADSTDGGIACHMFIRAGARGAAPHYHPGVEERFRVLAGSLCVRVGDDRLELGPGTDVTIPAGAVHDWWVAGDEDAQVLVQMKPGRRFELMLSTMFGLANEGKTDASGMPGLLRMAVIAREFRDTIVLVRPPAAIQALVVGVLAPIGRMVGYRAYEARYVRAHAYERPDRRVAKLLEEPRPRLGLAQARPRPAL